VNLSFFSKKIFSQFIFFVSLSCNYKQTADFGDTRTLPLILPNSLPLSLIFIFKSLYMKEPVGKFLRLFVAIAASAVGILIWKEVILLPFGLVGLFAAIIYLL